MRRLPSLVLLAILFTSFSPPTTVTVVDEKNRVEGVEVDGLSTTLKITDRDKVEKAWINYFKGFGKVTKEDGFLVVEEAYIPKISINNPCRTFGMVLLTDGGTKIWWGIELREEFIGKENRPESYKDMNNHLHQFGIDMYVNEVNEEIAQAEQAIEASVKEYEGLVKLSENLSIQREKNHLQKLKLEERLVQNRLDSLEIAYSILQNVKDQDSSMVEIERLKEAKETIRARLEDIK